MGSWNEDIELRMSKKMAQLTKVIYHLNTKNENNQATLQLTQEHQQAEIKSIIQHKDTTISK